MIITTLNANYDRRTAPSPTLTRQQPSRPPLHPIRMRLAANASTSKNAELGHRASADSDLAAARSDVVAAVWKAVEEEAQDVAASRRTAVADSPTVVVATSTPAAAGVNSKPHDTPPHTN